MHIGMASKQPDPEAFAELDFSAMLKTLASFASARLKSASVKISSGLETE
jgi:hypothetical protein